VGKVLAEAIELHRSGDLTGAEEVYMQVLEAAPEHADALHLLGVLAHQLGGTELAVERVKQSLSLNPDQPIALNNLGNMLALTDRLDEAVECYQRAIELIPDYAQAHHNLGNVLADCERYQESIDSYERAIELRPDDIPSRLAMGTMLERLGQFDRAVVEFQYVLEIEADSLSALSRLGAVLRKMDRLAEAREVYDRWLELSPENPIAMHLREACDPKNAPDRASQEYVKATFDGFAEDFDEVLADLDYRVPELLGAMAEQHLAHSPRGDLRIADLGCGTGLCATYLRGHAQRLVGVDLSAGMIARATEREVYDELVEAELTAYLEGCSAEYDLLVAADTLIYLGDLRSTFAAASNALRDEGKLLFSIEKLPAEVVGAEYRLDRFGRYAHKDGLVRRWLEEAGFEVKEMVETKLRSEGNDDAMGWLVMAYKA
jgi:predicted TPR repeat methyltransferase